MCHTFLVRLLGPCLVGCFGSYMIHMLIAAAHGVWVSVDESKCQFHGMALMGSWLFRTSRHFGTSGVKLATSGIHGNGRVR